MKLADLIQAATLRPFQEEDVAASCAAEQMERQQLYDAFARDVAEGYRSGRHSWPDADAAMNHLFSFAYAVSGEGLSDYAFLVYQAFDEGEYQNGGQSVTDELLSKLYDAKV